VCEDDFRAAIAGFGSLAPGIDPDHFNRIPEHLDAIGIAPPSRIRMARWDYATDIESEPEKWQIHRFIKRLWKRISRLKILYAPAHQGTHRDRIRIVFYYRSGERSVSRRPVSPSGLAAGDEPMVYIIDDDASLRDALSSLLRSVGLRVQLFGSAPELLQSKLAETASCLVLDIRLPGVSGLDFQSELAKANIHVPIIFMTGHGDIPMSVRAMKAGAIDFLTKPFRDQDMLDAVTRALERDRKRREDEGAISGLRVRFESLTPREREVMGLVTAGLMNKQIAAETELAEITVKIHRGHVMKKMAARSLADLVRMAESLEIRSRKQ
jgi:FixJ family two-component response regulator